MLIELCEFNLNYLYIRLGRMCPRCNDVYKVSILLHKDSTWENPADWSGIQCNSNDDSAVSLQSRKLSNICHLVLVEQDLIITN